MIPDPPLIDSYWAVPGKLMAGPHPGGKTPQQTVERITALLDAGIRCIVNLTLVEEELVHTRYEAVFEGLAATEALTVRTVRFSLFDNSTPSPAAVTELLDEVDRCIEAELPVYVHCMMGLGRTGVMVGCHLVRHGLVKPRGSIKYLKTLRKNTRHARMPSPLTDDQASRVKKWKPGQ